MRFKLDAELKLFDSMDSKHTDTPASNESVSSSKRSSGNSKGVTFDPIAVAAAQIAEANSDSPDHSFNSHEKMHRSSIAIDSTYCSRY